MRLSEELRRRTKEYASAIIRFYVSLPVSRREVQILGQQLLRSVRRGREFACRIAHVAMRSWTAAFIKPSLKPTDEIRNKQANRVVRTGVLAA